LCTTSSTGDDISQDLVIPKSKHLLAKTRENFRAFGVLNLILFRVATVDFDNHLHLSIEINEERSNRPIGDET